jgi:hypothetical protein
LRGFARPRYRFRARYLRELSLPKLQQRLTSTGRRTDRRTRHPRSARTRRSRLGCMRFLERMRTNVPLVGNLRTSAVAGAPADGGGDPPPTRQTDLGQRPGGAPRRAPSLRRPGCLPPPRSRAVRKDGSFRPPRRSPAHAARTSSLSGERAGIGHCKRRGAVTRDPRRFRENGRLCNPLESSCLGLTTQARQRGSTDVEGGSELIARVPATPGAAP